MAEKCTCTPHDHCRGRPKFKAKPCPCDKCKQQRCGEVAAKQSRLGNIGRTFFDGLRGPVGVSYFSNETLNLCLTFLLEIFGILAFFAIATLMFWVSVCYYTIRMAVAVKRAHRSVQLASGVVICLILLAFVVNLAKKQNSKTSSTAKCRRPLAALLAQRTHAKRQAQKASPFKCKMRASPAASKKCAHKPVCPSKKTRCAAKVSVCPLAAARRAQQRIYSDCEARKIFQNARRYSIPSEMKQPPALVIYVRDLLCRLVNRG